MKHLNTLTLAFAFLLFSLFSKAQVIENLEGELDGSSGGNDEYGVVDLILDVGVEPFWGLFFGFPGEPFVSAMDYARYPYEDGYSGLYLPIEEEGRRVSGQFVAHFQNNESTLSGGFFQLKFSPTRFLTLDVSHLQLFEKRIIDDERDYLGITNFNIHYSRIRHHKFHFWWGTGLMVLNGEELWGSPTVTGGTTIFVKKPLSIHADMQLGWPNGVLTQLYQARLQAHVERFLFYGGYQGVIIGGEHEPSWSIGTGIYF